MSSRLSSYATPPPESDIVDFAIAYPEGSPTEPNLAQRKEREYWNTESNYMQDYTTCTAVNTFFSARRRRLKEFICATDNELLSYYSLSPTARLRWGHDAARIDDHMAQLRIPILDQNPCILLQHLGIAENPTPGPVPPKRNTSPDIRSLDTLEPTWWSGHTIFMNTSGSGKTRTVLETLCKTWGLYFVCKKDDGPAPIGSSDLQTILKTTIPAAKLFRKELPEGADNTAKETNRLIAHRHICQVILSRLLILKDFLDIAEKEGKPRHTYQQRWLLLQLRPDLLDKCKIPGEPACLDIFESLTSLINREDTYSQTPSQFGPTFQTLDWSVNNLTQRFDTLFDSIYNKLTLHVEGLARRFCIAIDEVQEAAELHGLAFFSGNNEIRRPVLRDLIHKWWELLDPKPIFLLSGTGMKSEIVAEATKSSIVKGRNLSEPSIGCFDTPDLVRKYISQYIPAFLLERWEWEALVYRCGYWLLGRFRFSAAFVQLLIRFDFRHPHFLLNRYIVKFTGGFIPLDALAFNDGTTPEELKETAKDVEREINRIDFNCLSSLPDNEQKLTAMKKLSFERFLQFNQGSSAGLRLDVDCAFFVETGFARYGYSTEEVCYDEPLIHLAFDHWLRTQPDPKHTMWSYIADTIGDHSKIKGNGFEKALALYFAHKFSTWSPLGAEFLFLDGAGTKYTWRKARLVTYFRTSQTTVERAPVSIPFTGAAKGPCHVLGFKAEKDEDVVSWLRHDANTFSAPFCFPTENMGPDLLFFLELEDDGTCLQPEHRVICVAVQAKCLKAKEKTNVSRLTPGEAMDFFSSLTPRNFFNTDKYPSKAIHLEECFSLLTEQQDGLKSEDMPFNIFRVLAVYPQRINDKFSIKNYAKGAKGATEAAQNGQDANKKLSAKQYNCQIAGNVSAFLDPLELRGSTYKYRPKGSLAQLFCYSFPAKQIPDAQREIATDTISMQGKRRLLEEEAHKRARKRPKLEDSSDAAAEDGAGLSSPTITSDTDFDDQSGGGNEESPSVAISWPQEAHAPSNELREQCPPSSSDSTGKQTEGILDPYPEPAPLTASYMVDIPSAPQEASTSYRQAWDWNDAMYVDDEPTTAQDFGNASSGVASLVTGTISDQTFD